MSKITRRQFNQLMAGTATISLASCVGRFPLEVHSSNPPQDILLVVLDDLGFSDLGFYGSEIRTPHIDLLARNGVSFNNFYVYPRCSPTRAALLTGQTPHEVGIGFLTSAAGPPMQPGPYQGYLTPGVPTIASMLKQIGYGTYMAGKWHLGEAPEHWPRQYGFDRYFGLISGASSYYALRQQEGAMERRMANDDEAWLPPDDGSFYMTDAITDAALGFLEAHHEEASDAPFFLYLAYTAPHWPLHAPDELIESYDDVYAEGWEPVRDARARQLALRGFDPRALPIADPPAEVGNWDDYEDRDEWQRKMQTHAAMVTRADQGIGAVIERLRHLDRLDNTIILVMSDNPASSEEVESRGLHDPNAEIGTPESFTSLEKHGAFVANTPFRDFKGTTYEGGVRSPLIVYLPALGEVNGRVDTDSVLQVLDVVPTLLSLAHSGPPTATSLAGNSFAAAIAGESILNANPVYAEHLHWRMARHGRWKAVRPPRGGWELYNLANDPAEAENLAASASAELDTLVAGYQSWAERTGVRPITMEELRLLVPIGGNA